MINSIFERISLLESELSGSTPNASSSSGSRNLLKDIKRIAKDLKETRQMCEGINAFLTDAEMGQIANESVRLWLDNLRRWTDDAEKLMDEYEYEYQRLASHQPEESSCSFISPLLLCDSFRQEFAAGLRELNKQSRDIAKRRKALRLTKVIGSRPLDDPFTDRPPCGSIPGDRIFLGRENELQQLKELLLGESSDDCHNIEVVAVIGMGGIGKTTVAQHVYNDPVVVSSFRRGWVSVAERFDVAHLLRASIESLSENACEFTEVSTLQVKLRKLVENKQKALLVLDDVWNEDTGKWGTFIAPFAHGAPRGSKILLTTRIEDVASTSRVVNSIRPRVLSEDEGWSLLREHALGRGGGQNGNINISEEIKRMGKEIVWKCRGLPLAIKVLGGLLNSMGSDEEDSWKYVVEKNLSELEYGEGGKRILGSLYLSYLHLRPQLKACFRLCSIYCRLWVGKVVMDLSSILKIFWMCFDIVKDERDAERCLQELKSRCFLELETGTRSLGYWYRDVSMHDLLHDLAEYVFMDGHITIDGSMDGRNGVSSSSGFKDASVVGRTYDVAEADVRERKLRSLRFALCTFLSDMNMSTDMSFDVGQELQGIYLKGLCFPFGKNDIVLCSRSFEGLKRIRILSLSFFTTTSISCLPPEIFQLYNLRYLKLTGSSIELLPESLGNLRNLRWLDLADNQRMGNLPESISRLVNLQELDVFRTRMDSFPAGITNLTNLLRLSFDGNLFTHMPAGFGNLRKLQYLGGGFMVGSSAGQASLAELKHLLDLKDWIGLRNLRHVKSAADAEVAGMRDKKHIRRLQLCWRENIFFPFRGEVVFPFGSQEWVATVSLHERVIDCLEPHYNLEDLEVTEYQGSKLPSWMGDDSFTKLVHIHLQDILYCISLSPVDKLPSLVKLKVRCMDMLSQVVSDHNDGSLPANTEWARPFPKLEEFSLFGCPRLSFLSLHDFSALKMVEVAYCYNMEGMDLPSNDASSLESVTIENCPRFLYTPDPPRPRTWRFVRDSTPIQESLLEDDH